MPAWLPPLVGALAAALLTYLGIARRASGRIATTEAAKLWDEAGNLREVYRDEIDRLNQRIEKLEREKAQLEARIESLEVAVNGH